MITKTKTIGFRFGDKHKAYIKSCRDNMYNIAEGAVRAGKTVDNVFAFAQELKNTEDKIHIATGSTIANAKLNIGDANGFGLEYIFRNQCKWGKYKSNECLYIKGPSTKNKLKIVIFSGGAKADSFKKIRGNSYGMWIATEINLHHENTIKEVFNRTIAAKKRKIFWDLNPDNPNAVIYKDYIDKYKKKNEEGELLGGYNYEHFTIDDNINISDERREEIKSQYDKTSIWYRRDILGERCIAEGLIYRKFADHYEKYLDNNVMNLWEIIVGVDFGGTGSAHAFVAVGITHDYREVIALSSERHTGDIDPEGLNKIFIDFIKKIQHKYGYVSYAYCDSAEQVLIRGFKNVAYKEGIDTSIRNSLKEPINERINLTSRLIAQDRFKYTDGCKTLVEAMRTSIWNPKEITKNERLDDGTTDVDTLDAFEYTIERYTRKLLNAI